MKGRNEHGNERTGNDLFKFTPASGTQVTVGRLTSIGEIAPDV